MKHLLVLMFWLLMAGCDSVLYENLTQREANKIVSALRQSNIHADRNEIENDLFSVTVAEADFADAITILEQHGLPHERLDSMADVFNADGLISTPLQERARLAYALSQELTRSLTGIDGITDARVHLTLSRERPLTDERIPATASVLLNHAADFNIDEIIPDVKLLVAKGVPDLSYRKVSVVTVPQRALSEQSQTKARTSMTMKAAAGGMGISETNVVILIIMGALALVVGLLMYVVINNWGMLRSRLPFSKTFFGEGKQSEEASATETEMTG